MDDFTVYGDSFDECLDNLTKVLKRCIDTNLVLNYEKCHFMATQGIVLGHVISSRGIEVDKAKVDIIANLPYRTNVKEVRSFLGHAGFYRRFIKDFSKIALPLTNLLQKEVHFEFRKECKEAFDKLKEYSLCRVFRHDQSSYCKFFSVVFLKNYIYHFLHVNIQ